MMVLASDKLVGCKEAWSQIEGVWLWKSKEWRN